jgi:hypothetical protein
MTSPTHEDRFARLIETLLNSPDVSYTIDKKGFGSSALKVNNKIFAMLAKGRLVVKLPRQRVDALIEEGDGERFDPGHGRLMKEWFSLNPESTQEWLPLAQDALVFVRGS